MRNCVENYQISQILNVDNVSSQCCGSAALAVYLVVFIVWLGLNQNAKKTRVRNKTDIVKCKFEFEKAYQLF